MSPADDLQRVLSLRDRGALFFLNHSGGKDSQAMTAVVRRLVPDSQLVVIHADLPEVEWDGLQEHIRGTIGELPFHVASAIYRDGSSKTLLGEWERKGKAPSPAMRWCTSDLKRGPIEKVIRRVMRERGATLAVNCMGMRSDESCDRAKLDIFKRNARLSLAGREVHDWLPIHSMSTAQVFQTIAGAGQEPHPMYAAGMSRLSCCFCIMGSKSDLTLAAQLNPALYRRYVEMERKTGFTLQAKKTLEEVTGIRVSA